MSCTCGRDGWFSAADPNCPEHGTRGSQNHDYQRGVKDAKTGPAHSDEQILIQIVREVLDGSSRLSGRDANALTAEIARRFALVRG